MAATTQHRPRTPREHAVDKRAFGTTHLIEWSYPQSGKTEHYANLIAAQTQHHYVVAISRRLDAAGLNRKSCAAQCLLPYDRFTKVMRGAVAMSLNDIASTELVLHEIVTPEVYKAIRETIRETRRRFSGAVSPHGSQ